MSSFEDAVIFVLDVEGAVEQLEVFAREVVATIVFQDYAQDEAGRGTSRRATDCLPCVS